jgi:uncharacterized protein (DUF305 family)
LKTGWRIGLVLSLALLAGFAAGGWYLAHASLRARSASSPVLPGPVDVGFAQFMSRHHDQAVVMTQIMQSRGTTRLLGLVRSIQTAQLLEIGQMQGWLRLWDKPLLPGTRSMDWMLLGKAPPDPALARYLIDCQTAPGGMPGMATSQALNQLRALDGEPRDRLFLELMIRHHQGGLPMALFAAHNARVPAVRALAAQMAFHQSEELGYMTLLLRADQRPK